MNKEYDVIIIGGGTAGLNAYRKAKEFTDNVLIIESKDFVTTCANVGCMPSKLFIAVAEVCKEFNHSKSFGINSSFSIDDNLFFERIRFERDRFVGFVKESANNIPTEDKIIGFAKFISKNEIIVNNMILKSKKFIISVGTRIDYPYNLNDFKNDILTNENIFELSKIPKNIAVIGLGVIGTELGIALKNLGSDVTFFGKKSNFLNLSDSVSNYFKNLIHSNLIIDDIIDIKKENNQFKIVTNNSILYFDNILLATGRKSNIDLLNLSEFYDFDLKYDYNNLTMQLKDFPIYLAGDVNLDKNVLHEAVKEGQIAGYNATHSVPLEIKRNVNMMIAFTSPQVMKVGEINNSNFIIGSVSFENQGRSRIMLKNEGVLNLYFDNNTFLLKGADMIGPNAENFAHLLAWCIEKNTTIFDMLNFPYYHPVVEEGIKTAVRNAATLLNIKY